MVIDRCALLNQLLLSLAETWKQKLCQQWKSCAYVNELRQSCSMLIPEMAMTNYLTIIKTF